MARGEYGPNGSNGTNGANGTNGTDPALNVDLSSHGPVQFGSPSGPDPWASPPAPKQKFWADWTDDQRKGFARSAGLSAIGSVAGAVLWKEHRIWGFILGGMAGGGLGKLIFAPRDPLAEYVNSYN